MNACAASLAAQSTVPGQANTPTESIQALQERISKLEAEVSELTALVKQLQLGSSGLPVSIQTAVETETGRQAQGQTLLPEDRKTLDFLHDATVNLGLDGYYAYNFNHPVGRVNVLRAYDVLSNEFSLNQASVIFDRPPDLAEEHRWGGRVDLQFGQATDTLQGNPSNEPRPQIYRNIFQAYGTYVVPIGSSLGVSVGACVCATQGNHPGCSPNSVYHRSEPPETPSG